VCIHIHRTKSFVESSRCRTYQLEPSGSRLTLHDTNRKCCLVRNLWYESNKTRVPRLKPGIQEASWMLYVHVYVGWTVERWGMMSWHFGVAGLLYISCMCTIYRYIRMCMSASFANVYIYIIIRTCIHV